MKKAILGFMGFLVFACAANVSYAQQANTGGGTKGGACSITAGPNKGKTGTYDGTGFCCTKTNGGGDCTECQRQDGTNSCKSGTTKAITPSFGLNGTWTVTAAKGQAAAGGTVTINLGNAGNAGLLNTFSATNAVKGSNATGILIDKSTIRITYPDTKVSVFGTLTSAKRIDWSDGSYWTRK